LFVAVDPPAWASEQLVEWARGVAVSARAAGSPRGSLRLLDADSLHLTLCFLGSRPVGEIEALSAVLGPCAEHACELSVGAPLWLPPRRPHALAVEIHDRAGELLRVHERTIEALCGVSGWQPERRRFRPHITLARVRGGQGSARRPRNGSAAGSAEQARASRAPCEQALPATPKLSFTPEAIVLYRSWLTPGGAIYEALASSELAAAGR
jgi:RNA 2',3'-cyclic 3'-phosphodiesterase